MFILLIIMYLCFYYLISNFRSLLLTLQCTCIHVIFRVTMGNPKLLCLTTITIIQQIKDAEWYTSNVLPSPTSSTTSPILTSQPITIFWLYVNRSCNPGIYQIKQNHRTANIYLVINKQFISACLRSTILTIFRTNQTK